MIEWEGYRETAENNRIQADVNPAWRTRTEPMQPADGCKMSPDAWLAMCNEIRRQGEAQKNRRRSR